MPDSYPDDGATTQDLRDRFNARRPEGRDELAATEQKVRSRGYWLVLCGTVSIVLVVAVAAVWHAGFGDQIPGAYALPLYATAFGAIFLGAMEMMFRPYRTAQNKVVEEIHRIEHGLRLLVHQLPEEMQQRWYAGYSRGHEDGRQVRTGTDDIPPQRGTGDVLKLVRRSDNQGRTTGPPSR